MPDLGNYAGTVLSAYAITFILLIALVWISLVRSRKAGEQLSKLEAKRDKARNADR